MRILKLFGISMVGVGLAFAGSSTAFAKAHDQGQADGRTVCTARMVECQSARDQIDILTDAGVLDGQGVSAVQNKGKRGTIESNCKGDAACGGRVDPQSRPQGFPPGQNKF